MKTRFRIKVYELPRYDVYAIVMIGRKGMIYRINFCHGLDQPIEDIVEWIKYDQEMYNLFERVSKENIGYTRKKLIKKTIDAWYDEEAKKNNMK